MDKSIHVSKRIISILIIATIMGAGSFAIFVQGTESQDKFAAQHNTKPKTSSFVFTGLPVEFDKDADADLTSAGTADSEGTKIISGQKIVFNVLGDIGDEIDVAVPIVNHSADEQIIMIKCTAPPDIGVDIEPHDAFVTTDGLRLVEMNTWILNVEVTDDDVAEFNIEFVPKRTGTYQVMCQILPVG